MADWKINGTEVCLDKRDRSNLHIVARRLLKEAYPTLQVLEETSIPIRKNKTLFLDFYLPIRRLAIEVQGEQHFKFTSVFHKSPQDFIQQQKNDSNKQEWCEINGLELRILRFDDQKNWADLIRA